MFGRLQYRPGTMDKQGPQIGITSLAYPEQDLFTPTGVLTWNQSEPGSQLSAILEIVGFTNGRNQRAGGNRANTIDGRLLFAKLNMLWWLYWSSIAAIDPDFAEVM